MLSMNTEMYVGGGAEYLYQYVSTYIYLPTFQGFFYTNGVKLLCLDIQ